MALIIATLSSCIRAFGLTALCSARAATRPARLGGEPLRPLTLLITPHHSIHRRDSWTSLRSTEDTSIHLLLFSPLSVLYRRRCPTEPPLPLATSPLGPSLRPPLEAPKETRRTTPRLHLWIVRPPSTMKTRRHPRMGPHDVTAAPHALNDELVWLPSKSPSRTSILPPIRESLRLQNSPNRSKYASLFRP